MFGNIKDDLEAAFLEFCGTVMFLLIGLGGIQAVTTASLQGTEASNVDRYLYIAVVRAPCFCRRTRHT
jgi:aquaporin related protein